MKQPQENTSLMTPDKVTPLPMKQMTLVMISTMSEGLNSTLVLPFIVFMIRGFGYPEKDVGFFAGILTSSLYMSQFISSYAFGRLSDWKGRKPFMLLGLLTNAIFIVGFGMSLNFWMALVFRSLIGLLNGNTALLKCITREIADNSNQSRAFSLRATSWGVGFSLGPIIGGWLSNPNQNIGNFFPSFFDKYPYLLPCIFSSLINIIGFILCIVWFEETKPPTKNLFKEELKIDEDDDIQLVENKKEEKLLEPEPTSNKIIATLLFISFFHFYNIFAFNDLFNIWAAGSKQQGGIEMSSGDLGICYSVAGVANLTFQAFLFTPLERKLTTVVTNKIALSILIPSILLFPHAVNKADDNKALLWFTVLSLMVLQRLFFTAGNVTNDIMVNNASSSENVGKINGINGSLQSLGRLFGPLASGSIYSLTAFSGRSFPMDYSFMFSFLSLTCLINFLMTLPLKNDLNNRKAKK